MSRYKNDKPKKGDELIIMDEELGQSVDVDSNNNLGRKLNVKS